MQNGVFIRVFIASPGDVQNERDAACQVVNRWNAVHSLKKSILIEPVRVETHSHAVQGGHPQDLINGQLLDRCDLLVAILNKRAGLFYSPIVKGIVDGGSTDAQLIESTLDGLLGFAGSEEGLSLYKMLCRHYWDLDPASTASYIEAYRDMWDEDSLGR